MASFINTNIASLNAQRNLNTSQASLSTSLQRLSTGLRINSAKDDAAGLSISERMTSQIKGIDQAARNANDAISMSQTAEGALSSIGDSLQRLRELAVQSANGSNTDIDRKALQEESAQLISEIDRVASSAKFNGRNLLDGSLKNQQFQVGANVGETISFSVNSARTNKLGSSDAAAISSSQNASTNALKEGDLFINGVSIGASVAASDTASTANASGSAIAKAAAINAKSSQTGVTATVNATEVAGTSMTGAAANGTIKVNGVTVNVSTTTDTAATRSGIVAALNAVSDQTGVKAIDTGLDSGGVKLVAADGRNIDIDLTTVTDTATGIKADSVNSGSITLNSTKDVTIASSNSGDLSNIGLKAGSYSAQTAYASSKALAEGTTTAFTAGDFKINGVLVGASLASSDTASFNAKSGSAISKAAAINAVSSQTGVTATANATEIKGAATAGAAGGLTGVLNINGVDTGTINTTTDEAANRKAVVDAINAISGQTGVVAVDTSDDSTGVRLVAADGRNITAVQKTGGTLTAADTGLGFTIAAADHTDATVKNTHTTTGTVTLSSTKSFTLEKGTTTNGTTALNLSVGTYGAGRSGQSIDSIDISTVDGANKALTAIDNALASVNSSKASMGAVQNRFSAVVSNLQSTSENLSASRSRIRDADFAAETANLSRGQILQQAGTAMLAQANSLPNGVLSLLRG